jgi:hypothetical protein
MRYNKSCRSLHGKHMRTFTLWFLFVLLLFGVLAFSWVKYQREIALPTVKAEAGSALSIPPRSAAGLDRSTNPGR